MPRNTSCWYVRWPSESSGACRRRKYSVPLWVVQLRTCPPVSVAMYQPDSAITIRRTMPSLGLLLRKEGLYHNHTQSYEYEAYTRYPSPHLRGGLTDLEYLLKDGRKGATAERYQVLRLSVKIGVTRPAGPQNT